MTNITYTVQEYAADAKTVQVTYTNPDNGFTHERTVNVPRTEEDLIDEDELNSILESQLLGVLNKISVGVITFTDPNESETEEEEETTATTNNVESEIE